jgi:hypothetical protein
LDGLDRKLLLHTTGTTSHDSTPLITIHLNPNSFLPTLWAREKLGQPFLRDMNYLPSSPPHLPETSYVLESTASQYFMFAFKNVDIGRAEAPIS